MKATIYDVAQLAGVSSATVSRVINNKSPVKKQTRAAVLDAIEKLQFKPNNAAVSLSGGSARIIGYVCPKILNLTNMHIAAGIERVLNENGYGLFISSTENSAEKERGTLKMFQERRMDLVILSTCMTDAEYLHQIQSGGLPVILVDRYLPSSGLSMVHQNCFSASYELTKYVIEHGHRDIAIVNSLANIPIHADRQEGFFQAMRDFGLPVKKEFIWDGQADIQTSYRLIKEFILSHPKSEWPTAIYVTGELIMQGIVEALLDHGVKIPEDISIVSYGAGKSCGVYSPNITGVEHMLETHGEQAALLALRKLKRLSEDKTLLVQDDESVEIPAELVIGNSLKTIVR